MTENNRKNLIPVFWGFLLGVFVCIAIGGLYFSSLSHDAVSNPYSYTRTLASAAAEDNTKYMFSEVEEVTRDGHTYFLGKIKNEGSSPGSGISIEVNLFLKDKFVDQYSTYMIGELGAGEVRYFKVSCGCKDQTPAQHDNYEINAVGRY